MLHPGTFLFQIEAAAAEKKQSLQDACDWTVALGYDCVCIDSRNFSPEKYAALSNSGLTCQMAYSFIDFRVPGYPEQLEQLFQTAKQYQIPFVMPISGGKFSRRYQTEPSGNALRR